MIKGMILDVDGVIIGEKIGFNSPWPHPSVIERLKAIRTKGVPVCLTTARPYFALKKIVSDAYLVNPHVTDGGSIVIDPTENLIMKKHVIEQTRATKILALCLENNIYVEFYTLDAYYIQANQASETTAIHSHILQKDPQVVLSLLTEAEDKEIIQIMMIAKDPKDMSRVAKIFGASAQELNLYWAVHPVALPMQFGIVVPLRISKTEGVIDVVQALGLSFENVLGVGDSTSDWQFIHLCKYAAAMGNASPELKHLVMSKGSEVSYVGPHVDDNGILEIFNHFEVE